MHIFKKNMFIYNIKYKFINVYAWNISKIYAVCECMNIYIINIHSTNTHIYIYIYIYYVNKNLYFGCN